MTTLTTTRLAPSPTGALHLGNARTFLVNWLLAAQRGWRVLMRIEDLDGPRVKAGSAQQLLDELAWLGLTWEQPVVYQSQRADMYRQALRHLAEMGAAYPCVCSRKDIEQAASAPHAEDGAVTYPGTCRGRFADADAAEAHAGRPAAWRLRVDGRAVRFRDEFAGDLSLDLAGSGGDFVIFKSDGLAAYQLAVVVDDCAAGVDAIVRGDDLLDSAGRQIFLRQLLGLGPEPRYWHLPLVTGRDGRRLAKRHGDTRLAHYRSLGTPPQRIVGLLAHWCGVLDSPAEIDLPDLLKIFDLDRLSRRPVVFTPADDAFLTGG